MNAYPGARRDEHKSAVCSKWNNNQNSDENPEPNNSEDEDSVAQLMAHGDQKECMDGDGEHKETTCRVSDLQPKSLQEACCRRRFDFVLGNPFDTYQEGERLLEIGDDQVVDENDILVVSDVPLII